MDIHCAGECDHFAAECDHFRKPGRIRENWPFLKILLNVTTFCACGHIRHLARIQEPFAVGGVGGLGDIRLTCYV